MMNNIKDRICEAVGERAFWQVSMVITSATVRVILWSVRHNGIDKTIEDLRKVCSAKDSRISQEVYIGMLKAIEEIQKQFKKRGYE